VNETPGFLETGQRLTGAAPGTFICFEGGDGAGKSTQVALLTKALERRGQDVVVTRQPGGTELGARIRDLVLHGGHMAPRAEALLYAADKAQHVDDVVRPALLAGRTVVTDRYTDSSIAYQGVGRELGAEEIRELQHWAVGGLFPDLTIVLDVTPETGRARRGAVHDRLEAEADDFHAAVRQGFLDLAARDPERYLVVDAGLPADLIHAQVLARLDELSAASPATRTGARGDRSEPSGIPASEKQS
jgi:dTMP kinase